LALKSVGTALGLERIDVGMEDSQLLEILLAEYNVLKAEQGQRIGFRDNIIYVTLGSFGAILSFAIADKVNYHALLLIPWVCVILGWTYLVNDDKISAIGRYIRDDLEKKIQTKLGTDTSLFDWEEAHRGDRRRKRRKFEQLVIDLTTFVFSGISALIFFWHSVQNVSVGIGVLSIIELIFLVILGCEILAYADLNKNNRIDTAEDH
jgi:hypothetical protein